MSDSSNSEARRVNAIGTAVLVVLFLGWMIYDKGFSAGTMRFYSFAYFLALFCLTITISMGLMFRQVSLNKIDYLFLAIVLTYLPISLVLAWPALLFLSLTAISCGLFVGTVSYFLSPYRR